jgi:prophage antirepressor-like protein
MLNRKPGGHFEKWVHGELLSQLNSKGKVHLKQTEARKLYVRVQVFFTDLL